MKQGIHPEYGMVAFRDRSAGTVFLTRSTLVTRVGAERVEVDGISYPVFDVEISSASHPFWTGAARIMDTAGRVEKFERRYGRKR